MNFLVPDQYVPQVRAFTDRGYIVIDGEPCPNCWTTIKPKCPCVAGYMLPSPWCDLTDERQTLQATCPTCNYPDEDCYACDNCNDTCLVDLGRFTVQAVPVVRFIQQAPRPVLMGWHWVPDTYYARVFEEDGTQEWWIHTEDGEALFQRDLQFDPLPQVGQFIVKFERHE